MEKGWQEVPIGSQPPQAQPKVRVTFRRREGNAQRELGLWAGEQPSLYSSGGPRFLERPKGTNLGTRETGGGKS